MQGSSNLAITFYSQIPCTVINSLLSQKHNTSQSYYFANKISQAIQRSSGVQWKIKLKDAIFDSQKGESDYVQKYYEYPRVIKELQSIIQYYKYYGQKATLFIRQFYQTLLNNQEKQKLFQYNKLKKLLNLHSKSNLKNEDSAGHAFAEIGSFLKYPEKNILSGLTLEYDFHENDNLTSEESYCVRRLRNILSQHFNKTKRVHTKRKRVSLKKIDQDYQKTFNNSNMHISGNKKATHKRNQRYCQSRANTSVQQRKCTVSRKLFKCQKALLSPQKIQKFFEQSCEKISSLKISTQKAHRKRLAYASCQVSKQKQKGQIMVNKNRKFNEIKTHKRGIFRRYRSTGSQRQKRKVNWQQYETRNCRNLNMKANEQPKKKKDAINSDISNKSLTTLNLWRKTETQSSHKTSHLNSCLYTPNLIGSSNIENMNKKFSQKMDKQRKINLKNQKQQCINEMIGRKQQLMFKRKSKQRIALRSIGHKKANKLVQLDQKKIKQSISQIKNTIRNKNQRLKNKRDSISDENNRL